MTPVWKEDLKTKQSRVILKEIKALFPRVPQQPTFVFPSFAVRLIGTAQTQPFCHYPWIFVRAPLLLHLAELNSRLESGRERLAILGCLIHANGPRKDLAVALPQDLSLAEVMMVRWQETHRLEHTFNLIKTIDQ